MAEKLRPISGMTLSIIDTINLNMPLNSLRTSTKGVLYA